MIGVRTWLSRGALLGALLPLSACDGISHRGFLAAAGPVAAAERSHFFFILWVTLIVIVPLFVATPIVLWKYRLRKKGVYRPEWTFSWIIEGLIWGIPVVIVAVLGWQLWHVSRKLDPYAPLPSDKPPLNIEVVSLDWKWLFIYPEQGIATANVLEVPVDRPLAFTLTSATVMQSFFIPRLGSQIYTMPGSTTELHLLAAVPGHYLGMNTQYNGKGFATQKFLVHAVDADRFAHWVHGLQSQPPLDTAAYDELAKRSILDKPKTYGSVAPDLFKKIIEATRSTPAVNTLGAAPRSEPARQHETERLKKERRAESRGQGA